MELAALLDLVYEAAVVPEAWTGVLQAMQRRTSAAGACVNTGGPGRVTWIATDVVDALISDYPNQPHVNPRIDEVVRLREPGFVTDHDLFDDARLDRDPFYADFMRPRDLGWCAANVVFPAIGQPVFFSVEKRYSDGPVTPEAVAGLNLLRPHLARSATLAARFSLERTRGQIDILNEIGLGAAVLGSDHRIRFANPLFQALMPHLVRDDRSRITAADASADLALAEALGRLDGGDFVGRSIPIRATLRHSCHVLHLLPVRRSAQDIFGGSTSIVLLMPAGQARPADTRLIESLLDLTPTEARLAKAISEGLDLAEIARRDGCSIHTVRTHLKSIFSKTGVGRQAELVRLVSGMVPLPTTAA